MIKVNLLKGDRQSNRGTQQEGQTQFSPSGFGSPTAENNVLIKKFALLLLPIILAYGYSWYVQNELNNKKEELNNNIKVTEQETEGLKPQLEEIEKLNQAKNKIKTHIDVIRDISKNRYQTVKIMDSLQSLIPEKAWLTKFSITDRSVYVEGRAIDDIIISTFMQNLEESAYFSNVSLNDSKEINEPQGLVKQFSIKLQLERI